MATTPIIPVDMAKKKKKAEEKKEKREKTRERQKERKKEKNSKLGVFGRTSDFNTFVEGT